MLILDTHCHALPHWFEPMETLLHQWTLDRIPFRSVEDKEWIFGKTALSLFKFAA